MALTSEKPFSTTKIKKSISFFLYNLIKKKKKTYLRTAKIKVYLRVACVILKYVILFLLRFFFKQTLQS